MHFKLRTVYMYEHDSVLVYNRVIDKVIGVNLGLTACLSLKSDNHYYDGVPYYTPYKSIALPETLLADNNAQ